MKARYYVGPNFTNFGDELNRIIWPACDVPLKDNSSGLLIGIGTLLNKSNEPLLVERPLLIFGSGCGFEQPADITGAEVFFLRGPKSAALYDNKYKWITDPSILVSKMLNKTDPKHDISFMPHWKTIAEDSTMPERLKDAGIHLMDPRRNVVELLYELSSCKLVLAEAMHGAIVADALRIPWIPVYGQHGHLFKWLDWTQSMDLPYDPVISTVSSLSWAVSNVEPFLSDDVVFESKLDCVILEVYKLKERIRNEAA